MLLMLIVSIVVAAFLFITWNFQCRREILAVNAEIKKLIVWLETPREFQDIDAEFRKNNRLSPVWKIFEKSLTKTNEAAYSTTDAAEIFSTQSLTRGMNMTFWQAYGGIFTGLGILGTFVGLTIGLSGLDISGNDIETLQSGIVKLLSGVESAFVTSLVGILCAIFYNVAHHWLMKKFQGEVKSLTEKLDETFPRRSAEDWLAKNCQITDDQTNSIKEIGEAVTQAIYDGLDEKLGEAVEKLDPLVEKICEAIENLEAGGTNTVGEIFSNRVGTQMDRFSGALDKFSDSIDEKLRAANEVSKIMNEQLLQTLKELSDTLKQDAKATADKRDADYKKFSATTESLMATLTAVAKNSLDKQNASAENFETTVSSLLEALKNFAQQQKNSLDKTATTNAMQISEAVKSFRAIVDRHNGTTQEIFSQVQNLLEQTEKFLQGVEAASYSLKQAAEPVTQSTLLLTKNLEATHAQMKILSAVNQTTRTTLFNLTTQLSDVANNFNGVADELERSTKIISGSLDNYNDKMSTGLSDALTKFGEKTAEAVGQLQSAVEDLSDTLGNFNKNRR